MQARLLVAQREDLACHRAIVVLAFVLAPRGPGLVRLLAQVAPVGEGEERHDVRARQRDDPRIGDAALDGGLARGGAHEVGQPGELFLAAQHQAVIRLVGQHVLRKACGELGQALHHLRVACLGGRCQAGAGAHEVEVDPLQQALLLRRQAELVAPFMQLVDAPEKARMHVEGAVVRRHQRRELALDRLQRGRGFG